MTELTFLLDLLVNHKLAKPTKDAVLKRIGAVEQQMLSVPRVASPFMQGAGSMPQTGAIPPHLVGQSPSTVAAMMRHEQQGHQPTTEPIVMPTPQTINPVVVAQTPAAAAALADRNAAISQAISGKPEKGRTSPRKF